MKLFVVLAAFVNKVAGACIYAPDGEPKTLKVGDRIEPPATFSSPDAAQLDRLTRAGCLRPKDGGGKSKGGAPSPDAPVSHSPAETLTNGGDPSSGPTAPETGEGLPAASQDAGGGEAGTDANPAPAVPEPAGGGRRKRAESKPGASGSGRKKKTVPA